MQLELPKIEHRMCVKHMYENLKKNHAGKKQMKPLIWSLAWSYNDAEFSRNLDKIRCYDVKVYADVLKSKPKTWCRAYYKLGNYCEDVDNNSTESFNNTIKKAREMPFVPMLNMISRLAMARIARRSAESHTHNGKFPDHVVILYCLYIYFLIVSLFCIRYMYPICCKISGQRI